MSVTLKSPIRTKSRGTRAIGTQAARTVRPVGRERRWCASVWAPCGSWWTAERLRAWTPIGRFRCAWPRVWRLAGTASAVLSSVLGVPRTSGTSDRRRGRVPPVGFRLAAYRQSPGPTRTTRTDPSPMAALPERP